MKEGKNILSKAGNIGKMTLKNRIVMPAMATNRTYKGHFTDEGIHYYGLRAKGGSGLIIIEYAAINYPSGRCVLNCSVDDDKFIPSLKKLTDEVHQYNAKICLQIAHAGRQANSSTSGSPTVSCSDFIEPGSFYKEKSRALTLYETQKIIKDFGASALRAKKAGFDAVEAHFAHGYLACSFLSPFLNQRSDEYGGMKGGLKFVCEVIKEIKEQCGKDFPVLARINGDDFNFSGGVTHIDARMVAVALENAGVDCINISAGLRESKHSLHDLTGASPRGSWLYLAAGIKKAVNIPVMIAKRISEDMVEGVLESETADFVCIGRPQIADPEYANKLLSGNSKDILPCIWCSQGCNDVLWMLASTTCLTNPAAGMLNESSLDSLPQVKISKKVLVIGGGPAGCEFALVAAKRGHEVVLHEKGSCLGGSFRLAAKSPSKVETIRLIKYMETALPTAGVEVNLNSEVTPELLDKFDFDAVVLATGATPYMPTNIPIQQGTNIISVEDVMEGKAQVGKHVGILTCGHFCNFTCGKKETPIKGDITGEKSRFSYACSAGYAAVDVAEYLASQEKLVSIITEREDVVPGMGFTSRNNLIRRFYNNNIRVCSNAKVKEINNDGVILEKADVSFLLNVDTVIVSVGMRPNKSLVNSLKQHVKEVYFVGDVNKVGNAMTSIASAFDIASKI